jgi:hypothetical protein
MKKLITAFVLIVTLVSCKNNGNEKDTNKGLSVRMLSSPAGDSCAEPFLFTDNKGYVYLSWVEKKGKLSSLKFSILEKGNWSEPVTMASGKNWFVNWADYPVIASDGSNNILAHFLEKSDTAKFTYDVKLISSADGGNTWSSSKILHDDGKKAEHGFVSITPYKDQFFLSWLDGRKTATEGNKDHQEGHHGEMTVRAAMINKDGSKTNDWELDGRVCDCCQTGSAITSNGPIVVYRDRSEEEIRDISIVRFVNGEWTKPKTIFPDQWKIAGCPVNGPRADAIKNNLAIAWFSMPENKAQVKIIFSDDGGATFKAPIQVDEGKPIGRVDVVMLNEKMAMISWMEGSTIKALKVNSDGTKGKPIIIATSSNSRSSGFPQMTKTGNSLIFAWTDSKSKMIKLASILF